MNKTAIDKLVTTASRRELTDAERAELEACLAREPALRAVWHEEEQLNELLRRLPEPAVSTNFTARVLEQVGRRSESKQPMHIWAHLRTLWLVRHAWQAAIAVILGMILFDAQPWKAKDRAEMANLLSVLPANGLANVELWSDFESIRHLPDGPLPSVNELAEALR